MIDPEIDQATAEHRAHIASMGWDQLWGKIGDLKCQVRTLFSEAETEEQLGSAAEYADQLIFEFDEVYRAQMMAVDPELIRDFWEVFSIRYGALRVAIRRTQKAQWDAMAAQVADDLYYLNLPALIDGARILRTAVKDVQQSLESEEIHPGRLQGIQGAVRRLSEDCRKYQAPLAWLEELRALQEDRLDLKIRVDYLTHRLAKQEKARAEAR